MGCSSMPPRGAVTLIGPGPAGLQKFGNDLLARGGTMTPREVAYRVPRARPPVGTGVLPVDTIGPR